MYAVLILAHSSVRRVGESNAAETGRASCVRVRGVTLGTGRDLAGEMKSFAWVSLETGSCSPLGEIRKETGAWKVGRRQWESECDIFLMCSLESHEGTEGHSRLPR